MKACPKCKSTSRHRMKRSKLMRLIPGTRKYACDNCNTEYTWFGTFNISLAI